MRGWTNMIISSSSCPRQENHPSKSSKCENPLRTPLMFFFLSASSSSRRAGGMKKKQKFLLWRQKFMASIKNIGLESEEVSRNESLIH